MALTALFSTTACNDYETYGELKDKERDNIERFINDSSFVIISEDQFHSQGDMTIGDKQFVQLTKSGVYMQIVRKGCGEKIKDGESLSVICRFWEISVQDTSKITNTRMPFDLDVMNVSRNGSTYSATFIEGLMLSTYGSSVPEAWLVPLPYINIGRLVNPEDETARVKMIVPHSQGTTSNAKSNVKPYYYDITFQRGR
jgi:hypothetical protein